MKYPIALLVVCLAAGAGVLAQDSSDRQAPQTQKPPADVTLTGCVVQGSSPSVWVFTNARKDPKDPTEPGVKYVLMGGDPDVNIKGHLNHEVQITGVPDGRTAPPADQKVEEKDIPVLRIKSLVMIAPTCTAP